MKNILLAIFIATCLLFLACDHVVVESPNDFSSATKTELLAGSIEKSWALTSVKINGKEFLASMPDCAKDDILTFRRNKNFDLDEGSTKCRATNAQIIKSGSWDFNTTETDLILNQLEKYTISELTISRVILTTKNIYGDTEEKRYAAK